jgi:2Fe-2S ferredoxin
MPKVTFLPGNQVVEYQRDSLPYQGEGLRGSLLDVALHAGAELRHACGGICACITCHVIVAQGDEGLSPMKKSEEALLYRVPGYTLHSRLACQAVVHGDVVVRIPTPGENG